LSGNDRVEASQHSRDIWAARASHQPQDRPDGIVPRLDPAERNVSADSRIAGAEGITAARQSAVVYIRVLDGINAIDPQVLDVREARHIAGAPEEVAQAVVGRRARLQCSGHVPGTDGAMPSWRYASDCRNTDIETAGCTRAHGVLRHGSSAIAVS